MNFEKIIVLDFGSPSSQKLTRKIREFGTYSELHTSSLSATDMEEMNPVGIILAGGPFRDDKNFAPYDEELFDLDIPILGLGHGMQVMAPHYGGDVAESEVAHSTMGKMEVVEVTHQFEGFEKWRSGVRGDG